MPELALPSIYYIIKDGSGPVGLYLDLREGYDVVHYGMQVHKCRGGACLGGLSKPSPERDRCPTLPAPHPAHR